MTDFIESFDNILSGEDCKRLIKKFERDRDKEPGVTGHGYQESIKKSFDINISTAPNWAEEKAEIEALTWKGLTKYIRKYPHLMTGGISISVPNPATGAPIQIDEQAIQMLEENTLEQLIKTVYRLGTINLQRYTRKVGGYHHFHSEVYPSMSDPEQKALHRVLLFMFYLNDVREGGETEFFYQGRKLKPTRGQLVFAPAGFTHTHKGHIPLSNDKYIFTSWVLFRPAREIYANQRVQS